MISSNQARLTAEQRQQVDRYRARHARRRQDRPRGDSSDEQGQQVLVENEDCYQGLRQRFNRVTIVDEFKMQHFYKKLSPYVSELTKIYFCCALNAKRVSEGLYVMEFDNNQIDLISLMKINYQIINGILRDVVPEDWKDEIERLEGILHAYNRRVRINDDPWPAWRDYVGDSIDEIRQELQNNMDDRQGQVRMSPPSDEMELLRSFRASTLFGVQRAVLWNKIRGWRPEEPLTIKAIQPKNCPRCRGRLNQVDHNIDVNICGNINCSGSITRSLYDRLFVPNVIHTVDMTGLKNKDVAKKWSHYRPMWTNQFENNIVDTVSEDFTFDNRVSWRGSLAIRRFETQFAVLTPEDCPALMNAIQNERTLGLQIKNVRGWGNEQNLGVFATHAILPKTIVCVYAGQLFSSNQLRFWKQGSSRVKFAFAGVHQIILSPEKRANVGRYLNCSKSKGTANVEVAWILLETVEDEVICIEPVLAMISISLISPGQELRWYYGDKFVQNHRLAL